MRLAPRQLTLNSCSHRLFRRISSRAQSINFQRVIPHIDRIPAPHLNVLVRYVHELDLIIDVLSNVTLETLGRQDMFSLFGLLQGAVGKATRGTEAGGPAALRPEHLRPIRSDP